MPGSEILPVDAVRLLDELTRIIAHACTEIRAISPVTVVQRVKPDRSPVTVADELSEATILQGLARLLPGIPVISEESASDQPIAGLDRSFLIVDPLDGTREFIAGRDEFTVNLAIVTRGVPIAGIIAAPARGQVWRGVVGEELNGCGCWQTAPTMRGQFTRAVGRTRVPSPPSADRTSTALLTRFLPRLGRSRARPPVRP